jgi:hypothetical protein
MTSKTAVRLTLVAFLTCGLAFENLRDSSRAETATPLSVVQKPLCDPLPLPSTVTVPEFEKLLIPFIRAASLADCVNGCPGFSHPESGSFRTFRLAPFLWRRLIIRVDLGGLDDSNYLSFPFDLLHAGY